MRQNLELACWHSEQLPTTATFMQCRRIVLPDKRTVYTTDDGTNCGFFMFKADRQADLSSGKLYAAKLTQQGLADNFEVSWILLGSGE